MEFPKRLLVVENTMTGQAGDVEAAERLIDLPTDLLPDGVDVAIYRLARVKRLEVSRRLVKMDPGEPDEPGDEGDNDTPEPVQLHLEIPAEG